MSLLHVRGLDLNPGSSESVRLGPAATLGAPDTLTGPVAEGQEVLAGTALALPVAAASGPGAAGALRGFGLDQGHLAVGPEDTLHCGCPGLAGLGVDLDDGALLN